MCEKRPEREPEAPSQEELERRLRLLQEKALATRVIVPLDPPPDPR